MKIGSFLKILSPKDKLRFIAGVLSEKLRIKRPAYASLKNYRSLLFSIQRLGFNFTITETATRLRRGALEIVLRNQTSDLAVFEQVFIRDEYHPLIDCILSNKIQVDTIVDAGSNIGLTSIKLLDTFINAQIICIEPDPGNFAQLQQNLKTFTSQITALSSALWHGEETLYLNADFRDGKEWGRNVTTVKSDVRLKVSGISLNQIIKKYHLTSIDILKIDIEGSEAAIFNPDHDLSFLKITKVIAIEIHDEFNCRESIYELLRGYNFALFNSGEHTIGVNGNL